MKKLIFTLFASFFLTANLLADCLIYENTSERSYKASTTEYIAYDLPSYQVAYTIRVEFEMRKGSLISILGNKGDAFIYVRTKGSDNYTKLTSWNAKSAGITHNYNKYTVEIPYNTVSIMFQNGYANGSENRYVRNLRVYKDNVLNPSVNTLDFGQVKVGESKTLTLDLEYANLEKLSANVNSEYFSIDYVQSAACAEGVQTVKITFTPNNCVKDYNATLTFNNGKTVAIQLSGSRGRNAGVVEKITWTGAEDTNWDNRNNWLKEDGNVLSVADVLSEDLVVILPAGKDKYPILPDVSSEKNFTEVRDNACKCSQVNAGDNEKATMIAHKIVMEYGATLVGVETLNANGVSRYKEAEVEFVARRHDWLLIGAIVKPWDDENVGTTRNVVSGDYYLNDFPHVYMHGAYVDINPENGQLEASWEKSFTDLGEEITHEEAFAIRVPDQYGRNLDFFGEKIEKLPAEVYNIFFPGEIEYDGNAPQTFTFKGRFYNESSLPTYTLPGNGKPVILNNTYPANIDGQKLQQTLGKQIQYYDYDKKGFVSLGDEDKSIMSQHSFIVFSNGQQETIAIEKECFETTQATHRSTSVNTESFRVEISNHAKNSASEIYVRYDEFKDDKINYSLDAPKIFNKMEQSLPDLYVIRYDKKLSGLVIPTISEPIPLGINVGLENQSFTFSLKKTTLGADVILEDRLTQKQYNLSEGETCEINDLGVGVCEGRFYLLLAVQEESDEEVTTEVKDVFMGGIDIYTQENAVVVSSASDIELIKVIVADMSGRGFVYNVSGHYVKLDLPMNSGVYTISVLGDKASRVEKIKLI